MDAACLPARERSVPAPSSEAAIQDEMARIGAALKRLSPAQRDVITLARISGLSHAEIAARLGKSEGTVRTMLCRALAELAEHLR